MEKNGQYNSDIIFKINIYYDFCNRGEWLWVRGVGGGVGSWEERENRKGVGSCGERSKERGSGAEGDKEQGVK